jgi:hypothetical protein
MENSNENAHLNIETVTPDTEKDGQPNDQKYNHRVENEGTKEANEQSEADTAEATADKDPYAIYEKTDLEGGDGSTPKAPDNHGDGAPEVETVSP